MPDMNFTKMHGLGNDFVCVACDAQQVDQPVELVRVLSDRHRGIGCDGLILMHPSDTADMRIEIFNADGSRPQMCGNGVRCVAKFAVDRSMVASLHVAIDTDDGIKHCDCEVREGLVVAVRVDMGIPDLSPAAMPSLIAGEQIVNHPFAVDGKEYELTCVSMGNPHAVIFVDDLEGVMLEHIGPLLECAPEFPERINVHFVRIESSAHVTMRTWERGAGATRACGTGASAVCVAGALTERTHREITATLPGGDLLIKWAGDGHVYMTGPAVEVYSGVWCHHRMAPSETL